MTVTAHATADQPSRRERVRPSLTELAAYDIDSFCAVHSFSRSKFYELPEDDKPELIYVGAKPLITREAAARWREKMEARRRNEGTADLMKAHPCRELMRCTGCGASVRVPVCASCQAWDLAALADDTATIALREAETSREAEPRLRK